LHKRGKEKNESGGEGKGLKVRGEEFHRGKVGKKGGI